MTLLRKYIVSVVRIKGEKKGVIVVELGFTCFVDVLGDLLKTESAVSPFLIEFGGRWEGSGRSLEDVEEGLNIAKVTKKDTGMHRKELRVP